MSFCKGLAQFAVVNLSCDNRFKGLGLTFFESFVRLGSEGI